MTAPVSRRTSSAPPLPSKEPTPAQVGKLAAAAQSAEAVHQTAVTALNTAKEALKTATPAQKATRQKTVDQAQKMADATLDKSSEASAALQTVLGRIAGPKLAKKTERLYAAYEQAVAARAAQKPGSTAWRELDAAVSVLGAKVQGREEETLIKAKWVGKTNAESNMDGLADLASRTRDEQIRLVGAPVVNVSTDQAAAFDRKKVSLATKGAFAEYGIQMLKDQLEGADEAGQLKLLQLLANPQRDLMSLLVDKSADAGSQFMVEALGQAKGKARELLLQHVVKGISSGDHGVIRFLATRPQFGKDFALAGELAQALKKAGKPEAAAALMGGIAQSIATVRKEFEAAKKTVDAHNAEFARTVAGYAGAVDPKALEAYRDSFVKKHQADFDTYNEVAGRYMEAFKAGSSGGFGSLDTNPFSPEGKLRVELSVAVQTNGEALLSTESGKKELDSALKLQMLKQPSWLDQVSAGASKVKDRIELPGKVADLAAKAMVRVGIGKGLDPGALTSLVRKNARLLGISGEQADSFAKLMGTVNQPGLTDAQRAAAYKRAAGEISGGEYANAKSMKALGLLLSAPGLIGGWLNIKDKSTMEVISHSLDTLGFANDLLTLFTDAKVLGTAGKLLGGAGAAIGLVKGVAALSEGKLFEGGTALASAAGGALLMVPGGQLFGAALIVGSAIASAIWGDDPAADAEAKQEANVKEFLTQAGIRPEIADVLKDVLQTDHRSTGPFIEQMAEYLGVKPSEFLQFLNGRDPGEVRALVKMVKNLPADKNWNFTKAKDANDYEDTPYEKKLHSKEDWVEMHPRSLETAKGWMKSKGLLPPGAK